MDPKFVIVKYTDKEKLKYAVVPSAWVTHRRPEDHTAVMMLPKNAASIEPLVKNNAPPAADFIEHLCVMLYTCDNYSRAKIFTMEMNAAVRRKASPNLRGTLTGSQGQIRKYTACPSNTTRNTRLANNKTKTENPKTSKKDREGIFDNKQRNLFFFQGYIEFKDEAHKIFQGPNNVRGSNKENDTRCTLRHPRPGPGLVELYRNSKVYVEKEKLEKCTSAKTSRRLVEVLLPLIFTDETLSSCTLRLKRNRLDAHAVKALVEHGKRAARRKGLDADEDYLRFCVATELAAAKRRLCNTAP